MCAISWQHGNIFLRHIIIYRHKKRPPYRKNGVLNGQYKTLLADGKYNIRKLNLTEIERLQNLPEGYTDVDSISDQQRTSLIGNGWTIDIIAHIFSYIKGCQNDN